VAAGLWPAVEPSVPPGGRERGQQMSAGEFERRRKGFSRVIFSKLRSGGSRGGVTARPWPTPRSIRHLRAIQSGVLSGSEPILAASAVVTCSAGDDGRHGARLRAVRASLSFGRIVFFPFRKRMFSPHIRMKNSIFIQCHKTIPFQNVFVSTVALILGTSVCYFHKDIIFSATTLP
jgi:hypothetical protein